MEQFAKPVVDWLSLHSGPNRKERETTTPPSSEQASFLDYIYPDVSELLPLQKVASQFVGLYVRSSCLFNTSIYRI